MASILIVAPVLAGTGSHAFTGPDGASFVWSFWWMRESVEALRWPMSTTHIFAPVGTPLAFHTGMPALALVSIPLQHLLGTVAAYNVVVALAPLTSTFAMYALARDTGLERPDSAIAGIAFGAAPVLVDRLAIEHLNLAFAAWMPLALLLLRRTLRERRWQTSIALGVVLALALGTDLTIFIFTGLVLLWYAGSWSWRRRGELGQVGMGVRATVPATGAFALLAAPLAFAMLRVVRAGDYLELQGLGGALAYSADLLSFVRPAERSLWAASVSRATAPVMDGRPLDGSSYLGVVIAVLAIVGLLARRRAIHRWAVGLVIGGCALAVGPVLHVVGNPIAIVTIPGPDGDGRVSALLPFTWLTQLPLLEGLRSPGRFVTVAALGLALLCGVGCAELRRRWPSIPAGAVVCALAALLVADASVRFDAFAPLEVPAVVGDIAADPARATVANVPLGFRSGTDLRGRLDGTALLWATVHGQPVASGFGARTASWRLDDLAEQPFYAALLAVQEGEVEAAPPANTVRASRQELGVVHVLVQAGYEQVGPYLVGLGFEQAASDAGVALYRWKGGDE